MRGAGLGILIVAGVAVLAVGGFLVYLNWAFTPRGPSRGSPAYSLKARSSGPLGDGMFYCIFETRTEGASETIYGVKLAGDLDTARKGGGSNVLWVTNSPVPIAVRPIDADTIEVEFEGPVRPSGARQVRVSLRQVESTGFVQISNGVLVD